MKNLKKVLATAATVAAMSALCVIPAFAATAITDVYISIVPDDDEEMSPGDVLSGMEPDTDDDDVYYVDEYELSNDDPDPRKSYTYTMYVEACDGYYFTSSTAVHIYGAYECSISKWDADELKVKAKAYPFHVLDNPDNVRIDYEEEEARWDEVPYAKDYSVVISYETSNGNDRSTKKTTSKTYLDISGYMKYDDLEISVQARKGSQQADKYIANSDYITDSGEVDDDYSDDEFVFNIPTAHSNGATTSGSSSSSSGTTTSGPGYYTNSGNGWSGSGDTWYYYQNGALVTGWIGSGDEWYYCDSTGLMQAGWIYDGSHYYYLNTNHDGTYGKMLSGYYSINGKSYYFNEAHDGTFGAMFANQTAPDGRYAGSDGVLQ